jgi:Flp pilus assembly protein TadG
VPICPIAMRREVQSKRANERGSTFVEFALLFPMIFFLVIGTFDVGYLINALMTVENAARIAALDTSASSGISTSSSIASAIACGDVLKELAQLPNHGQLPSSCNASPLQVTATATSGPDGNPASKLTVTYQTIQLIPIPGVPGNLSITRVVEMSDRS